jgi:hypothetical protein
LYPSESGKRNEESCTMRNILVLLPFARMIKLPTMRESRITLEIAISRPQGRRSLGSPRGTREDNIEINL